MKKLFLILILCCSMLFCSCADNNKKENVLETEKGCELLFSFENYDENHNTIKEMGNRIGRLSVSDENVTQGKKSLKVEVHGKFNKTELPYMKIFCSESNFLNGDFSWFKSIRLDVFNANEKDLHIKINLNVHVLSDNSLTVNTEQQVYTLKANSKNVLEYEIPEIESVCDLQNINYIFIQFDEAKDNPLDAMNILYLDNLRGVKSNTQKESGGEGVDLEKGVSFEKPVEALMFNPFQGMEFTRKTYADIGVEKPITESDDFGEYLLMGNNPGKGNWPGVIINFGKSYPIDTEISFWIYVDTDSFESTASKPWFCEAYYNTAKDGGPLKVETDYQYNQWVEVKITFRMSSDQIWFFFNMSDRETGAQLIDGDYRFYIDNFIISTKTN